MIKVHSKPQYLLVNAAKDLNVTLPLGLILTWTIDISEPSIPIVDIISLGR